MRRVNLSKFGSFQNDFQANVQPNAALASNTQLTHVCLSLSHMCHAWGNFLGISQKSLKQLYIKYNERWRKKIVISKKTGKKVKKCGILSYLAVESTPLKNMLVKMGSSSPSFGVKIPKMFELPPPRRYLMKIKQTKNYLSPWH